MNDHSSLLFYRRATLQKVQPTKQERPTCFPFPKSYLRKQPTLEWRKLRRPQWPSADGIFLVNLVLQLDAHGREFGVQELERAGYDHLRRILSSDPLNAVPIFPYLADQIHEI